MPIYEYHCDACDNVFEEWHRHADDETEQPCPKCRKTAHRLISNTSFVLKGGGWYVTEYGNRKSDAHTSGAAKDASSTESAPAGTAKTETAAPPAAAPAPKAEPAAAPAS